MISRKLRNGDAEEPLARSLLRGVCTDELGFRHACYDIKVYFWQSALTRNRRVRNFFAEICKPCQKIPAFFVLRLLLPASQAGAVASGHVGLCFPASAVHSTAFPSIKGKELHHLLILTTAHDLTFINKISFPSSTLQSRVQLMPILGAVQRHHCWQGATRRSTESDQCSARLTSTASSTIVLHIKVRSLPRIFIQGQYVTCSSLYNTPSYSPNYCYIHQFNL